MKKTSDYLWGLLLVIIGIIFGINALGIAKIDIFFEGWWTLFIIIPSLVGLVESNDKKGSLVFLIVGILLLLSARDIISFALLGRLIVPIILVLLGLIIIFKRDDKGFKNFKIEDTEEIVATFSEQNVKVEDELISKSVSSVFGKVVLDLSDAKLKKETYLKVEAVFGSIYITVPENVDVKVKSSAIFGSIDNKSKEKNATKTIYIEGTAVFGGVTIQ